MSKVLICNDAYFLSDKKQEEWYIEKFGSDAIVSENERHIYYQELGNNVNEQIADELIMTAKKIIEQNHNYKVVSNEDTGISFGSAYGCINQILQSRQNIAEKAEKGIRPKEAVNNIPCGAASKAAIALGLKAFNHTNFNCHNAGMDAIIFAFEAITENRAVNAIAISGDCNYSFSGVLLSEDNSTDNAPYIIGYSKGLVYGDNQPTQINYLINKGFSLLNHSTMEYILIIDESGKSIIENTCKNIDKFKDSKLVSLDFPENATSSKGIFALNYITRHMKPLSNAIIIQLNKEGFFSSVIIEHT